ncbi:YkvI family membrane protein [Aureibacillus halotolerans]|uniref:Putative membrane protein YkvI n=1 Tax=Aureibacillus halotolerans TaxID=1508390 RepID=A0A4R6U146_9BACI|nr:hypothetical protein [Aureibacillus halotolerans]TDQ38353.1 putative membrane protein YkvI [Aureibacillus halotolerans]
MWRAGFKWIYLILGTIIGAGYASGREIWQFFGEGSSLAIALFTVLFAICCYVIMSISRRLKTEHYLLVLQEVVGLRLAKVYDVVIVIYLFMTTFIMLAGGGATLESFDIPYVIGVAIICIAVVVLFFWGTEGMLSANTFILPILVTSLVVILFLFLYQQEGPLQMDVLNQSNWPASLTFTALNLLSLTAVLSAVGHQMKTRGELAIASVGSAAVLGGLTLLYNTSLSKVAHELVFYEIPLFAILKNYPWVMIVMMSLLLWFAIYTTALACIFGLVSRLKKRIRLSMWQLALLFVLLMLPFTGFGFGPLIDVLYPIYGLINLYLFSALLLYPITRKFAQ